MIALATRLRSLRIRRAARWAPPPQPRSLLDFCRTMRLPEGPAKGQLWDPATEPAQLLWILVLMSGPWRNYCLVCPSQRGKTQLLTALWFWTICELRTSVAMLMPNGEKLDQNWETKFSPTIEGSGLGALMPTKGKGSKGGRGSAISLRDPKTGLVLGRTVFMALGSGGKETSTSSATVGLVELDEADDAESAGQIGLTWKRIASMGAAGRALVAGTVNDRVDRVGHPILQTYESGTRSRLHHRCPHCLGYFAPDFENMNWDANAIACGKCGVIWSEADRHDALNHAVIAHHGQSVSEGATHGQIPPVDVFAFLTVGIDYHWEIPDPRTGEVELLIPKICKEYRAAKHAELRGDYSLMRLHMHKVWCRAYEEPVADDEINNEQLSKVSERSTYDKRMVPEWAQFLTMAQDVQGDRHYWLVVAHGPGERWAIIDWGYEYLVPLGTDGKPVRSPTPSDRIATLCLIRDLADTGWQVEGGDRRMRPVMRGVDIGYLTDEIVSWVQGEPAWKAVRGVGEDEAKHVTGGVEKTLPEEIRRTKALIVRKPPGWRVYWYKVDGHHFRRAAHAALLRDSDAMASGMLPRGLKKADMICLHLSGEVWKDDKPGKPGYWFMARKRHDLLDCLIYNLGLALLHRYAPERRDDGDMPEAEAPHSPTPINQSGWVESVVDGAGSSWING